MRLKVQIINKSLQYNGLKVFLNFMINLGVIQINFQACSSIYLLHFCF